MSGGSKTVVQSSGSSNNQQQVTLPQWMSTAGEKSFNDASSWMGANPVTPYKGQLTAPLSPTQNAAIAAAKASANTGQSQVAAGGKMLSQATTGSTPTVSSGNWNGGAAKKYMSPYIGAVQQATVSDLAKQGLVDRQALGDEAAAAHAYGGMRQGVEQGVGDANTEKNILDYLANSNEQAYENAQTQFNTDRASSLQASEFNSGLDEAARNRAITAAEASGELGTDASNIAAQNNRGLVLAGQTEQDSRNAQDQAAYNEYLRQQTQPMDEYSQLMAMLSGTPHNLSETSNGTTSGSQTQTQSGGLMNQLLGAAMVGASFIPK